MYLQERGLRPFCHPWLLLSPYEFMQRWRAEPLMPPGYYVVIVLMSPWGIINVN